MSTPHSPLLSSQHQLFSEAHPNFMELQKEAEEFRTNPELLREVTTSRTLAP
jgi:hypothetical protein